MKLLSIKDYIEFKCIGGDCPITCCGGNWNIGVDKESADYYRSVEGDFGDELRNGMKVLDGETYFNLKDNGDCIFLNENKLCRIYRTLGEDKMCLTCRSFPRLLYDIGDISFCFLTTSCPEVTRMIMQKTEPIEILYDDSDEQEDNLDAYNVLKFNHALRAYNAIIHIMQNRDIALNEKLYLVLFFVDRFQELVKEGNDPSDLIGIFSSFEVYSGFLESSPQFKGSCANKIHAFMMVFKSLLSKAYNHPMWIKCNELARKISTHEITDIDILQSAFSRLDSQDIQAELGQLLTYRFIIVFMEGFTESDYFEKIAYELVVYAALLSYIALSYLETGKIYTQNDRILFYSLCSRTDHTNRKKTSLIEEIRSSGYFELDTLLKLIN